MTDHISLTQANQPAAQPAAQATADPEQPPGPAANGKRPADRARGRPGSRLALGNWRVRWRLLALVTIPTVTAIAIGGVRVDSAIRSAQQFQRIERLAVLGGDVTALAQALEDESDITAGFIADGRPAKGQAALTSQYATTDAAARNVRSLAQQIGSSYSTQIRTKLAAVLARISDLNGLRFAALRSQIPALPLINDYSHNLADLFSFNDEIAQGSANSALSDSVRTLGSVSRMKEQASQQRGILYAALIAHRFELGALDAFVAAQNQQNSNQAAFRTSATLPENQAFADTVTGPLVDQAQSMEDEAKVHGNTPGDAVRPIPGVTIPVSQQWYKAMSDTISRMRTVEKGEVSSIISQSRALQQGAARSALLTGAVVLIVLILVLIVTAVIGRSLVRPLRRLRAGALDVAGVRLPEKVRVLSQTGGNAGENFEVEPIEVNTSDEIGEVARAFDQVHREALRLAANEAMLRGNVNAMFVSLSRRSQSLVERQIRLIDELEQGEQDSERLANLFRMDHLATRMRRNSENLLVLAGHETARRWGKPVALVDVLRAAVSEIEQYERVTLNIQPGTSVAGNAVNDVVHLLAELLENATSFSPGDTPVKVAGHLLNSGGVLLDITDQGVGMGAEEMAHANWRLENPPVVDVAVSRRMGLFVVSRLAARHGIRVRLRQPELGGLTALVWLPDTLISQESAAPTTWLRRLGTLAPEQGQLGQSPTPDRLGRTWDARPPAVYNAPVMPVNTWPNPARAADNGPYRADTGPIRPADSGPFRATADTGPIRGMDGNSFRGAADTAPIHAAETGPMPFVQPMHEPGPVVVPVGAQQGRDSRLPIYESLESDWFSRRGRSLDQNGEAQSDDESGLQPLPSWTSAGDEGWRAAKGAAAPTAGPLTSAGLPRRVPQANIVPGSAGARVAAAPANPALSAENARERMASFQQGVRRARAAIKTENPSDG
ncbi:MAG: nitrate- and nitrite sensing domain-containing protein [Micromonosporaceae bacterium]